jgi:O-antigen ligase
VLLGIVILTAVYFRDPLSASISDFLQLKDEYRGLGTGATGRSDAWRATWKLFVDNPIFGVGFRAHEARLGGESSSHNGYLALLAEIGLVGFMAVMYLIATGVASLYTLAARNENVFSCSILLGLIVGFLIVGLFERYLLNVGNPTSLLFIVAITVACRRTAERNDAQETGAIRQWQILP